MSETVTPNAFPQARLDEMNKAAKDFDSRNLPDSPWRRHCDGGNFDAAESAFIARQLEYIRPGLFEIKYTNLKGKNFVPINTSMSPGAEQFTIQIVDQAGEVKVLKDYAKDLARVELKTSQASMFVYSLGLAYAYTVQEARAAMEARVPLQARKAQATRDQMARKLDDILFVGETTTGIKGLLNQTGTETYTVPSTGAGGVKTWAEKSPDNVLVDLMGAPARVVTQSKEIHQPNTMLLPLTSFEHIAGRRVGDGTNETILSYFKRTEPYGLTLDRTHRLDTAGGSSDKRMVVYEKNPTVLEAIVPVEFEQFAPQTRDMEVITVCHMRTGGVAVYYPKAICYADGI